jgi:hypothetical protein
MDSISETSKQVYDLLTHSLDLDDGDERISVLEEAVRLADLGGDLKLRYLAREHFLRGCIFGGATDKGLVAFAWCLAQYDQNPEQFDPWGVLWKYKWIVGLIFNFPQVAKARIYEMLADLAQRSQRAGYGLRAAYNHRYRIEKLSGRRAVAVEYFRKMEAEPRDALSNCSACEIDEQVGFSVYCEDYARALELAAPILDGVEKCTTVPHRTYAKLLLPLVRLGRQKDALVYHQKGYGLISHNKAFLDHISDHLIFLALTENFEKAITLIEKHFPWTDTSRDVLHHFRFFRGAWLLFELLADAQVNPLTLRLPQSCPIRSASGHYDAAQLASWFKQKAEAIGRRFDARNENDFFARTIAETLSLKALSSSFPLS